MKISNIFSHSLKQRQIFYIKLAGLITLKEGDFSRLIEDIESTELFGRLRLSGAVRYKKHFKSALASDFLEFSDALYHSSSSGGDVGAILEEYKDILPVISGLGVEKFSANFLYCDILDDEKTAAECGIAVELAKRIRSMVNKVLIMSDFVHPSKIYESGVAFAKIGRIEKVKDGLQCGYYSINMARGKYELDEIRLKEFRSAISRAEKFRLSKLLSILSLINKKKDLTYNIMNLITDVQKKFFETGDFRKLELISKKDVSVKLNVAPSTITRAVYAKSIVTPQDREIPLEALMPHRNSIIKYILPELLLNNPGLNDEMIRKIVAKDYNISVSRRYICKCRNEKKS